MIKILLGNVGKLLSVILLSGAAIAGCCRTHESLWSKCFFTRAIHTPMSYSSTANLFCSCHHDARNCVAHVASTTLGVAVLWELAARALGGAAALALALGYCGALKLVPGVSWSVAGGSAPERLCAVYGEGAVMSPRRAECIGVFVTRADLRARARRVLSSETRWPARWCGGAAGGGAWRAGQWQKR